MPSFIVNWIRKKNIVKENSVVITLAQTENDFQSGVKKGWSRSGFLTLTSQFIEMFALWRISLSIAASPFSGQPDTQDKSACQRTSEVKFGKVKGRKSSTAVLRTDEMMLYILFNVVTSSILTTPLTHRWTMWTKRVSLRINTSFFHFRVCALLANIVCKLMIVMTFVIFFPLTLQPPVFPSDLVDNLALASLNLVSHLELASVLRK